MLPQLARIVAGFEQAQRRLHRLVDALPPERWAERRDPARWSVAECVAHLNLTGAAYVPLVRAALDEARRLPQRAVTRYRRDAVGVLIGMMAGPLPEVGGVRLGRVRTAAPFVPTGDLTQAAVLGEFDRLQGEQIALVREADGLPIDRVTVRSPFDSRVRYNAYACLVILPRHHDRHLAQAEQVWREPGAA